MTNPAGLRLRAEHGAVSLLDRPPARGRGATWLAGAGTLVLHVALIAGATWLGAKWVRQAEKAPLLTQMVDIELPPEPVQPEPVQPVPEPVPTKAVPRAETAKPEAPPPAAAEAGQVLTAADDVVDFGDAFVSGKGSSYAGGVTEAGGTSKQAVGDARARAGGTVGGTGVEPSGDRSRAPQLAGGAVWDCPFPPEAEDAGVDHAVVTLRVEVAAEGRVLRATASRDPGYGFGREARRCALSKRWAPGLDRAGNPTEAAATVNVRFDR